MTNYGKSILSKLTAWLVIAGQIACQPVYADPKSLHKAATTLATPRVFQQSAPSEAAEEFRRSVLSDANLLAALFSISSHFLVENKKRSTLQRSIRDKFRNNPPVLDLLKFIYFKKVRRQENIVYIPYLKGGKRYEARICSRENLESLPKAADSQWQILENWAIQFAEIGPGAQGADEPLIGHGYDEAYFAAVTPTPWNRSAAFAKILDDLEHTIQSRAPDDIRDMLRENFRAFKEGKDDRRLGSAPSQYEDASRYYLGFATARSVGIVEEFLNAGTALSAHAEEALFHELYHAVRGTAFSDANTHFMAMKAAALIYWGLTPEERQEVMSFTLQDIERLERHPKNKLGKAIGAWKAAREERRLSVHSWTKENVPELVGKKLVSLSMEGNIPEFAGHPAQDANTRGGLGAYFGDKFEGLDYIGGMDVTSIQPGYLNGPHDETIDYDKMVEQGMLENVVPEKGVVTVWSWVEDPVLRDLIHSGDKEWIVREVSGNVELRVKAYRIKRPGSQRYLLVCPVFDTLYTDSRTHRFTQETVFGRAVYQFLKRNGIMPDILHLNEGHTVVAASEMRADSKFDRTAIVLTDHTPVEAGHEMFYPLPGADIGRMMYVMGPGGEKFSSQFLRRKDGQWIADFSVAAVEIADVINAVSDEHAMVTRRLFENLYKEKSGRKKEVTVIPTLNGSGDAWVADRLLELQRSGTAPTEEELWNIHEESKQKEAFEEVHKRTGARLDPTKLTAWMVRRLTDYKSQYSMLRFMVHVMCADRQTTFTRDRLKEVWDSQVLPFLGDSQQRRRFYNVDLDARMEAILNRLFRGREIINGLGMQVVIGGPEFEPYWVTEFRRWAELPELKGRFVYVPDSDARLLKMQAIGSDICINMPRPLDEACGTSDQRSGRNGGVNIAIRGAGPIEWITNYNRRDRDGSGFLIGSYTRKAGGFRIAKLARFYTMAPCDILEKCRIASDIFYKEDKSEWKRLMHNSYTAATYGEYVDSKGKEVKKKAVTARAMEERYARNVYSVAIKKRAGILQTKAAAAPQEPSRGNAISLTGMDMTPEAHEAFKEAWRRLIAEGKATSLFEPRRARLIGDLDIPLNKTNDPFFNALRASLSRFTDKLEPDFDIIIGDYDESEDAASFAVLHLGNKRSQAYISMGYMRTLAEFFASLDNYAAKAEFIRIVFESFIHEVAHLRQYRSTLGSRGPPAPALEKEIDQEAPSFRTRSLFRLAYARQKTGVMPDIRGFLTDLRKSKKRTHISYLNGYLHLDLNDHLAMAESLLSGRPSQADKILAQHHLGVIFNHAEIDSPVFQEAKRLIQTSGAIDEGPETERPFPVWKFIRELIRQNVLIEEERTLEERNVKAKSLDQFEKWRRGTQSHTGRSVIHPLSRQTTTLAVDIDRARERIRAMEHLDGLTREGIIEDLASSDDGGTVISREALEIIGSPLMPRCAVSESAAGIGSRYAEIRYDENGRRFTVDMAKAVYPIPADGERSILELRIAQIRGLNSRYGAGMPLDIYTSHFTDRDIRGELGRLGFSEESKQGIFERAVFTHPMPGSPKVHLIRIRKTSLFDERTGDFYKNVEPSLPWTEAFWPDAHDTAFIDFIVSGRAYECVQAGFRYKSTFNIDNCAGNPDPVVLAVMALTGASLLIEGALKPEGQRGGAIAAFKEGQVPRAIDFGHRSGILEEYEFDKKFLQGLTAAEMRQYFPLFNTANYTEDIIGFARDAFWKDKSDEEITASFKEFHDARADPEKVSELRFRLENAYRRKTQQWERDKRYPALQPSNLAGTLTWLVPEETTLYLEVPTGPEAGQNTRFEPLKENIVNFRNERDFVRFLVEQNSPTTVLAEAKLSPEHSQTRNEGRLEDIKTKYAKEPLALEEVVARLDKSIRIIEESLKRVIDKKIHVYGERAQPEAEDKGSDAPQTNGDMDRIHELNKELLPQIPKGRTMWHVIPISLCPTDPSYNQRTKFVEFVNRMNRDYPEAPERIKVVTERQDLAEVVRDLATDPDNIVDIALDSEDYIEKMPEGVKMLLFRPKDGDLGNFRQLEGMLAALRALHIDDFDQRKERLERIHELMTGERQEMPDIADPREFARRYQFILPPIAINDAKELKRLNENLLRLIEAA